MKKSANFVGIYYRFMNATIAIYSHSIAECATMRCVMCRKA